MTDFMDLFNDQPVATKPVAPPPFPVEGLYPLTNTDDFSKKPVREGVLKEEAEDELLRLGFVKSGVSITSPSHSSFDLWHHPKGILLSLTSHTIPFFQGERQGAMIMMRQAEVVHEVQWEYEIDAGFGPKAIDDTWNWQSNARGGAWCIRHESGSLRLSRRHIANASTPFTFGGALVSMQHVGELLPFSEWTPGGHFFKLPPQVFNPTAAFVIDEEDCDRSTYHDPHAKVGFDSLLSRTPELLHPAFMALFKPSETTNEPFNPYLNESFLRAHLFKQVGLTSRRITPSAQALHKRWESILHGDMPDFSDPAIRAHTEYQTNLLSTLLCAQTETQIQHALTLLKAAPTDFLNEQANLITHEGQTQAMTIMARYARPLNSKLGALTQSFHLDVFELLAQRLQENFQVLPPSTHPHRKLISDPEFIPFVYLNNFEPFILSLSRHHCRIHQSGEDFKKDHAALIECGDHASAAWFEAQYLRHTSPSRSKTKHKSTISSRPKVL